MSHGARIIDLEEGWNFMQKGITTLINILEGLPDQQEFSMVPMYSMIYTLCVQKPPYEYAPQLYDKYRETFHDHITSTVLPSLREKHDESMLSEFVKRWSDNCFMVTRLSQFFGYLDRYFVPRRSLPSLREVGYTCFVDLAWIKAIVYQEFNAKVRDAVISLIDKERDGEQIDRDLLKNVVNIFVKIGRGYYENDFEEALLEDTAAYYSLKASNWILEDNYMSKVEECLKREEDRVSNYLHSSTQPKLLQVVRNELSSVYATQKVAL